MSLALLERGDKVISTTRARSFPKLAELKQKGAATLELDVTAPLSELHAVAAKAIAIYGHIDVLVNNAGYVISGALEENRCVTNPGLILVCSSAGFYLPQPRANLRAVQYECFRRIERRSCVLALHAPPQDRNYRLDRICRRIHVSQQHKRRDLQWPGC